MEPTFTPESYQPEPADILRRKTIEFLKSKYPDVAETQLLGLVDSLMYDMLSENKISGMVHRFSPDEQEKALLSVGAETLDEAIDKIIATLPEATIEFHMKKLGVKREFDL
jgi:hypothetical protein